MRYVEFINILKTSLLVLQEHLLLLHFGCTVLGGISCILYIEH